MTSTSGYPHLGVTGRQSLLDNNDHFVDTTSTAHRPDSVYSIIRIYRNKEEGAHGTKAS